MTRQQVALLLRKTHRPNVMKQLTLNNVQYIKENQ